MHYLWFDESDKEGEFYTNFYGGILIESKNVDLVTNLIVDTFDVLDIKEEVKWQKVNAYTYEKYIKLVDFIFDLLSNKLIKIRIFFKNRQFVSTGLTKEHQKQEFPILYYHFIKHAFGLQYSNKSNECVFLKIHLDNIPLKGKDKETFIKCLYSLNNDPDLDKANIKIRREDIFEVDSKKHLPLQLMDLILGSMCFRLNNKHKHKIEGTSKRGKRTILKEKLYKHINSRIRDIRPGFNIGESTGIEKYSDRWEDPYRHWSFRSTNYIRDYSYTKKRK